MASKYSTGYEFYDVMEWINHISQGLALASRHIRLTFILYFIQLSFAVVIGFEIYEVMEASIGHSASVEDIIGGYNHTVLRDFINVHGASLSPLAGQMRWIILIYAIYSVFLHGGILNVLIKDGADWTDFWKGGAKFFRPFLVYGMLFGTMFLLWTALTWLPLLGGLFSLIEAMDRERPIFWILVVGLLIWLVGTVFIFMISISTRYTYIHDGRKFWESIRLGFSRTKSGWRTLFLAILFFGVLVTGFYLANFFLELQIGITSEFLILAFLLWQQIMIMIKIYLRIGLYSSLVSVLSSGKSYNQADI